MAVAVVSSALVRVAEDLVGLRALLELFLGCGIALVAIRVVLHGQFAVGGLELAIRGSTGDAENFVVVEFGHGRNGSGPFLLRVRDDADQGRPQKPLPDAVAAPDFIVHVAVRQLP